MPRLSEETVVATSPEATFAYITDQTRLSEWNEHVQSAEVVDGGPVVEGSRLAQHRRRNNRDFTLTFVVTAHEPPRRHVVQGSVFGVDTTVSFEISAAERGSRVVMSADVSGRGWRRLLAPLVTREMRKSTLAALAALEARLARRPATDESR
jgi:hypothetical protein